MSKWIIGILAVLIVGGLLAWLIISGILADNRWNAWTWQCANRHGFVAVYRGNDYECYINNKPTVLPGWSQYGEVVQ